MKDNKKPIVKTLADTGDWFYNTQKFGKISGRYVADKVRTIVSYFFTTKKIEDENFERFLEKKRDYQYTLDLPGQVNPSEELLNNGLDGYFSINEFVYGEKKGEKMLKRYKDKLPDTFDPQEDLFFQIKDGDGKVQDAGIISNFKKYLSNKRKMIRKWEEKRKQQWEIATGLGKKPYIGEFPEYPLNIKPQFIKDEEEQKRLIGRFVQMKDNTVKPIIGFDKKGNPILDQSYYDNYIDRLYYATNNAFDNFYTSFKNRILGINYDDDKKTQELKKNESWVASFIFGMTDKIKEVFEGIGYLIYRTLTNLWQYTKNLTNIASKFITNHPWITIGIVSLLLATTYFLKDKIYKFVYSDSELPKLDLTKYQPSIYNSLTIDDKKKLIEKPIALLINQRDKKYSVIEHSLSKLGAFNIYTYDEFTKIKEENQDFINSFKKVICVYDDDDSEDLFTRYFPEINKQTFEIHKQIIKNFIEKLSENVKNTITSLKDNVLKFICVQNLLPICHCIGPVLATEEKDFVNE